MRIVMDQTLPIYKLMILYFLGKLNTSISNAIISEFFLENNYTNYFNVQKALAELSEDDLIQKENTYNTTYYSITDSGNETLSFFENDLSPGIKSDIDNYLSDHQFDVVDAMSVKTDYQCIGKNSYEATCSLFERNQTILQVKINVPDEQTARQACEHFKERKEEIYATLLQQLM